jgi:hypothetical protein
LGKFCDSVFSYNLSQSWKTGFQVTLPCEGSPRIKKPSFSLQVAKISSRDGNHLLYEPGECFISTLRSGDDLFSLVDTRIVVKARENEFVPYKHTMVVSQDFRARFEAVKSALIRLSSPLNCSVCHTKTTNDVCWLVQSQVG